MFEFAIVSTAGVLLVASVAIYQRTRDVLHPLMFLGPMFFYGTVWDPWVVRGEVDRFLVRASDLNLVLTLNFLAVLALVIGASHRSILPRIIGSDQKASRDLPERERRTLVRVASLLAAWGFASYATGIVNAGGFVAAYSQAKGGGYAASGYLSEGMNLSLVATVMAALARYRRGWTLPAFALCAFGLLPNLLQGTFGGRRGPLFLALAAGMLAWFVVRRKAPTVWMVWPAVLAAGLAVTFVGSQRQFLYLGSGGEVSWEEFSSDLTQANVDQGNNFIYGAGFILATRYAGEFTWGRELGVNLFVRPIPRQLWPTKYEDVGASWATADYPGLGHITQADWLAAVGWLPLAGSSAISISDLYGEFSWGAVFVFFLIGRGFATLNSRRRTLGGMWALLYLEALILSIYLATQSFSAFYHRYLILAVPTVIAWRLFVERRFRRRSRRRVYRRLGALPIGPQSIAHAVGGQGLVSRTDK